ncbi:hypothetical protein UFOVP222_75 [uncultured Caudovirales phage]|uniref:Uncharacterized protein n=1 Tax=uncultured Caudovirales phage TaxID=2100421 RepID=A0A6J7WN33_9CAUD|nr:hypothetical protein UFOVP108_70 [uncultured Caudovirales phage]CAB5219469.1 hypothetical protein UFOVP222_75 [uncultured Caudovirales phage]
MDYFVGSLITLLTIIVVGKIVLPKISNDKIKTLSYGQSHAHELIKYIQIPRASTRRQPNTQSYNYVMKNGFKVFFTDRNAYWVKDGQFVVADSNENKIDMDSIKPVDIMGMDAVELEKMIFIIEKLTEGTTNDSRDSGNK